MSIMVSVMDSLIETIQATSCIVLGCVFISAGVPKLRSRKSFAILVSAYNVVPEPHVKTVAFAIPLTEVLAGVLLLTGTGTRIGALLAFLLLMTFSFAVAVNLRRRAILECGCFGKRGHKISWRTIARNAVLLVVAGLIFAQPAPRAELFPLHAFSWVGIGMRVVIVLVIVLTQVVDAGGARASLSSREP